MSKGKRISYIGLRSGKLEVIGERKSEKNSTSNHKIVICKCDCGRIYETRGTLIKQQKVKSCGCVGIEKSIKRLTKHGHYGTRLYRIWNSIKMRCLNPKNYAFFRYGGRGIKVCDEWKKDFMSFYNWAMSNGYKENLTIDRINNNGNYEPSNCRWADRKTQSRNRSTNRLLYYNGKLLCLSSWAEILGINQETIRSRLRKGLSVSEVLSRKM